MLKKFIVLAGIMMFGLGAFAQKPKPMNLTTFDRETFHFGYSVGINWMGLTTFVDNDMTVAVKQNPGININLITNLRLGKYLDLRFLPGIQFGQRDMSIVNSVGGTSWDARIESVYMDLPFLLKYRAMRVNNFAPYLIAGVNPRIDLTGGEIENWKPVQRLVKPFDVFPELGVGIDFYLDKVKVATELKFAVGMLNVYNPPPEEPEYDLFRLSMDRMLSRMVILSIHVE